MLNVVGTLSLAMACRFKKAGIIVNEHVLNREQTRRHVELFGRCFDFIHLNDLPDRLHRRSKKPFCLLTFDDGKRSNATVVASELERLGVPAAFYVVSSALDDQAPLWFDRYRALRKELGTAPNGLTLQALKQLPYAVLTEKIERACREYGIDADVRDDDVSLMTWDHARDLHWRGFSIGAHGHTHAILTRETKAAAFESIEKSTARVSEEIGEPCRSFAFPNGNYTAELAQHAIRCGATTVMTTEPMWVDPSFALWRLPRLQFFGDDSPGKIKLKAGVAATGLFLKNPDGTKRAYRRRHRAARRSTRRNLMPTEMGQFRSSSRAQTEVGVNASLD